MADNEHYNTLGVPRNAAPDQIRAAYKKLARKYHPDANPDDAAAARKFKEIQEAHSVLSDPQQRQQYDQFGKSFKQAGAGGQFHWPDGGAGGADLSDLLGGMFGGGGFSGGFGGGLITLLQPQVGQMRSVGALLRGGGGLLGGGDGACAGAGSLV